MSVTWVLPRSNIITAKCRSIKTNRDCLLKDKVSCQNFDKNQQERFERYQELAGIGQTSANISEVVSAAYFQRIDCLFVPLGIRKWGSFDAENNKVEVHEQQQAGDKDLMDFAVIHTLLNSGTVYAIPPDKVPGDAPLAAIFRY